MSESTNWLDENWDDDEEDNEVQVISKKTGAADDGMFVDDSPPEKSISQFLGVGDETGTTGGNGDDIDPNDARTYFDEEQDEDQSRSEFVDMDPTNLNRQATNERVDLGGLRASLAADERAKDDAEIEEMRRALGVDSGDFTDADLESEVVLESAPEPVAPADFIPPTNGTDLFGKLGGAELTSLIQKEIEACYKAQGRRTLQQAEHIGRCVVTQKSLPAAVTNALFYVAFYACTILMPRTCDQMAMEEDLTDVTYPEYTAPLKKVFMQVTQNWRDALSRVPPLDPKHRLSTVCAILQALPGAMFDTKVDNQSDSLEFMFRTVTCGPGAWREQLNKLDDSFPNAGNFASLGFYTKAASKLTYWGRQDSALRATGPHHSIFGDKSTRSIPPIDLSGDSDEENEEEEEEKKQERKVEPDREPVTIEDCDLDLDDKLIARETQRAVKRSRWHNYETQVFVSHDQSFFKYSIEQTLKRAGVDHMITLVPNVLLQQLLTARTQIQYVNQSLAFRRASTPAEDMIQMMLCANSPTHVSEEVSEHCKAISTGKSIMQTMRDALERGATVTYPLLHLLHSFLRSNHALTITLGGKFVSPGHMIERSVNGVWERERCTLGINELPCSQKIDVTSNFGRMYAFLIDSYYKHIGFSPSGDLVLDDAAYARAAKDFESKNEYAKKWQSLETLPEAERKELFLRLLPLISSIFSSVI